MKSKLLLSLLGAALLLLGLTFIYTYAYGPERALEELRHSRNPAEREKALTAFFRRWKNPNQTWQRAIDAASGKAGEKIIPVVAGSAQPAVLNGLLEEHRFSEAAAFIAGQPENALQGRLIQELGRQWLKTDEPGTLAWLNSISASLDRSNALAGIFDSLAENDPVTATNFALSLTDPFHRRIALSRVLRPMLRAGNDRAIISWLRAGAGLAEYDAARLSAIPYLARSDSGAATELLKDMVDPKMKTEAALAISRLAPTPAVGLTAKIRSDGSVEPELTSSSK
jgi:hypothetical protein